MKKELKCLSCYLENIVVNLRVIYFHSSLGVNLEGHICELK